MGMCLCASEECPRYKECLRGEVSHKPGIHTMSYLGEVCNKDMGYDAYIPIEGQKEYIKH